MKHYSTNSILATLFSILLLTSCQKDIPYLSPSSANAKAELNKSNRNMIQEINASVSSAAIIVSTVPGVDLKVIIGRIDDYKLKYTVANIGSRNAGASKVRISYACNTRGKTVVAAVPAIPGNTSVNLFVPVEAICFESDIQFTITVDYSNIIKEANETNNTYTGIKIN